MVLQSFVRCVTWLIHRIQKPCERSASVPCCRFLVSFESWIGSYFDLFEAFHDSYPLLSPLDLGSLGYSGEESIYVTKQVMDTAYEDSGTALDFYKSYNASHYDVQRSLGL